MVLRDLPKAAIGCRDDRGHLGQRDVGDAGTAIRFRHRDAEQAAIGIRVQLRDRQTPIPVTVRRAGGKAAGQVMRHRDRLGIVGDAMRGGPARRDVRRGAALRGRAGLVLVPS